MMTSRVLFRWAAAAVILSGVSMTVGGAIHPDVNQATITSTRWAVSHLLWWVGTLAGMVGLVGIYLHQYREVGRLGFVGFGLAWLGTAALSGAMFFEAIVVPTLLPLAPDLAQAFPQGPGWATFIAAVLTSGVLLGVGFLLFGTAMLRAAVLPRWAATLAIVGGISQGISFLLPRPVAALGGIAFGLGLVGLGHGLWISTSAHETSTTTPAAPAAVAQAQRQNSATAS